MTAIQRNDERRQRAKAIMDRLDSYRKTHGWVRPFLIELFGMPNSGKTTAGDEVRDWFRGLKYHVSTPREGAREIEWYPRVEPEYNLRTAEYALGEARDLAFKANNFHLAIFDRATCDSLMRWQHFRATGQFTQEEYEAMAAYSRLRFNTTDLFDLHLCLVVDVETALYRKYGDELPETFGTTVNPTQLAKLMTAHQTAWREFGWDGSDRYGWIDTSGTSKEDVKWLVVDAILPVMERRLDLLGA